MPSVRTRFNPHPSAPRLRVTDDSYLADVVARYHPVAERYFRQKRFIKVQLQSFLKWQMKPISGKVEDLRDRCIEGLCGFVTKVFNPVVPGLISNYRDEVEHPQRKSEIFSAFEAPSHFAVLNDDLIPLFQGNDVTPRLMNALVQLIVAKEYSTVNSYYSTHSEGVDRAIVLPPAVDWMAGKAYADVFSRNTGARAFANVSSICKPILKRERWYLCIIDLESTSRGATRLFDPHSDDADDEHGEILLEIK